MLVVDDIIVFPFKSLLMVFREIYNAAVQKMKQDGDRIRLELGQLYLSLEAGNIDEATFDERERDLLDRLDEIEAQQAESEIDEESTEKQGRRRRSRRVSPLFRTGNVSCPHPSRAASGILIRSAICLQSKLARDP